MVIRNDLMNAFTGKKRADTSLPFLQRNIKLAASPSQRFLKIFPSITRGRRKSGPLEGRSRVVDGKKIKGRKTDKSWMPSLVANDP